MSYEVKPGNIFGRIGAGVGRGFGEQLPKEIERARLASGLKDIANQPNQSPFQQFAGLASTPGATPQIIESGAKLLRQQAQGQALASQQQKPNPFENLPQQNGRGAENPSKIPSLTKEEPFAKAQEGYIPPSKEQDFSRAGKLYNETPAKFGNDPQKALDFVNEENQRNQEIATAYQTKHKNLSGIQDNLVSRLSAQNERLGGIVPGDLYSDIEDEAIQATKTRKEGGRGLTEQQAAKEYGDKLNDASRDFNKIREIGDTGIALRKPSDSLRSIKNLQSSIEKLGPTATDNYAKKLISEGKFSPKMSYALAQPVNKVEGLSRFIGSLPEGNRQETIAETVYDIPGTLEIAPALSKFVKEHDNASPLAIAYELEKKGYDPQTWLQYVADNADKLNIKPRQSQQASTPLNTVTPWNDWWLSSFTGL